MQIIVTSSRGADRPLRSKKRRQRRKCWSLSVRRHWIRMPGSEKLVRLEALLSEAFKNRCATCGGELGENFDCETCVASWPELTDGEKQRLDELGKGLIDRLFRETEREIAMDKVWSVLEAMQGEIAREVRVLLGEEQLDQKLFTQEQRDRRIEALKKCAAESTSDAERHLSWMKMHEEMGWVYGEEFNPTLKTHPNMKPWDELPASTRSKAKIFDIVAKAGVQLESALAG